MQSGAESKEKAPLPKAMVKPHVLTHVIDGFIIQEGRRASRHLLILGSFCKRASKNSVGNSVLLRAFRVKLKVATRMGCVLFGLRSPPGVSMHVVRVMLTWRPAGSLGAIHDGQTLERQGEPPGGD